MIDVLVPIRIVSVMNQREHWTQRAARAKKHRQDTVIALCITRLSAPTLPCIVTLTRIAPRALDDDNAIAGMKAARDGIADWMGVNDADSRVEWRYAQAVGKPKEYALRIVIGAK